MLFHSPSEAKSSFMRTKTFSLARVDCAGRVKLRRKKKSKIKVMASQILFSNCTRSPQYPLTFCFFPLCFRYALLRSAKTKHSFRFFSVQWDIKPNAKEKKIQKACRTDVYFLRNGLFHFGKLF